MPDEGAWMTPPAVAALLGIDPAKVISWIKRGELRAVDLAEVRGGRPRYRIAPEWLEQFLLARQTTPAPKPVRQRKAGFERQYYT